MSRTPLAAALAAACLLAACRSTDVNLSGSVPVPQAFDQNQNAHGSENLAQWWQNWHDPVLNALIERGLRENRDILAARSRLTEAAEQARLARADLGPTLGASALASVGKSHIDNPLDAAERNALARLPQAAALADDTLGGRSKTAAVGFTASWEPDIFGQKRSDADAARYAALGRQEQLYGTQLLVAGDIADHYFQARAAEGRLKTAERSISALQNMLRYVQGRFTAGHATAYDLEQARAALAAMQAKHSTIAAERAAHVRSIAVLTGQVPQGYALPDSPAAALDTPPAAPSGQTPQGMIERRPDIRANAAQVRAYAARLASAKADLLPRFTLRFMGQDGRIELDGDSALKGWGSMLSLGIQIPIFTNGRIKANIRAADARLQTALLSYDQVLLTALGEADTAYHAQTAATRQTALLRTAEQAAAKQAADAQGLFRYGKITLDQALRAEVSAQDARENLIRAQLAAAQAAVGLYKALGGGWSEETPKPAAPNPA